MERTRKEELGKVFPEEYQFNLSDFALFLAVMKNKGAYECTLSIILEEPEIKLEEVKVEEVILNQSGKRAIRLDAWAKDRKQRQFNMEMQNDSQGDHIPKRSRFYQGLLDTPILKSGKRTKYRELPSTIIIFITQEDVFHRDLAKYTFTEQCEEIQGFHLEDGTAKIFLNMTSKNGSKELISLLQYMKETTLENPNILVQDKRIIELDDIVKQVKEDEEWEAVQMTILEIGMERGIERGMGIALINMVCKKLKKGKTAELIADELEEEQAMIERIIEAAEDCGEYDSAKIYDQMNCADAQAGHHPAGR